MLPAHHYARMAHTSVLHMFAQQHIPLSPRHTHDWGKKERRAACAPSELTEDANQGNARVVRERGAHDGSATFSLGKRYLRKRKALVTTRRELIAMQAAPTSGRMVRPKAESAPAARGMVTRLKMSAQKRFCLMMVSVRLERS